MKVVVTGSRHYGLRLRPGYDDEKTMWEALLALTADSEDIELAHGGAAGADQMAHQFGHLIGMKVTVFLANWRLYGKSAGPRRNQQMLDEFKPDLVLAFPHSDSIGTFDMINKSRKAGISVTVYD